MFQYTLPLLENTNGRVRTFLAFDPLIVTEKVDDKEYKSREQWFKKNYELLQFATLEGLLECFTPAEGHSGCSISYLQDKKYDPLPKVLVDYQRHDEQLAEHGLTQLCIYRNLTNFQPLVSCFRNSKDNFNSIMRIHMCESSSPFNSLLEQWKDLMYRVALNFPLVSKDNIYFDKEFPLLWYVLICEALDDCFFEDLINGRSFDEMLEKQGEIEANVKIYLSDLLKADKLVNSLKSFSLQCYSFTK